MYIHKNNNINGNMTEQEQIFFEQTRLWSLYPRICPVNDDTDLLIYFDFIKRINAFHLRLVKLQREKLLFPPSIIQQQQNP
jgi:hypothetical protein